MLKTTHRKYDSVIPWLYMNNKEHLLDDEFRKTIPRSTINDWKRLKPTDYYGYQYREVIFNAIDHCELALENRKLKKTLRCFYSSWVKFRPTMIEYFRKNIDKNPQLIDFIQQLKTETSLQTVLKFIGINKKQYNYSLKKLIDCYTSSEKRCKFTFSSQISSEEADEIKALFEIDNLKHWSIRSKYYYGLRHNLFNMGKSTFYKYVKRMKLQPKNKRDKNSDYFPIRSCYPNHYLHMDTTYYYLLDDEKSVAIAFCSDNFSKMILGYEISLHNSSKNMISVLRQSHETILNYHPNYFENINLVNDGGSENNNNTVTEFLEGIEVPTFIQLIAKKTIRSSNSSIEAINKIYKGFLRYKRPKTLEELRRVTDEFVQQYNLIRPHGSLMGLTPFEAYTNHEPLDFSDAILQARKNRILSNKLSACKKCG